jgi:hypothetical protein
MENHSLNKVRGNRTVAATAAFTLGALSAPALAADPTAAPTGVAAAGTAAAEPAPPAPPYSLPWQLRPAVVGNVVRSDSSFAFYENAAGQAGSTVASTLLVTYKVTPNLAPLLRLGAVQNSEPGPMGSSTAFVNPIVGITYGRKLGGTYKASGILGISLPIGAGGDKSPMTDATAMAVLRGIAARSAMDNAMFVVNYTAAIVGVGVAHVANKLTVHAEATLLQLFRVRNEMFAPESTRTNLTLGLHAGYFILPALSIGAELRHQHWLSTPVFVESNPHMRDTTTIAIGPRFHFKTGNTWLRPGLSYSTGLDKPLTDLGYHIVQVDVPVAF